MKPPIDSPDRNDNRDYRYSGVEETVRPEYDLIASWIPDGAKVIDLGCGDGSLLEMLRARKHVQGTGVERSPSGVEQAVRKGLNVIEGLIDRPLIQFSDNQFDIAICNATIHMVMYPETLLREMKRLAQVQIVSFPNFGFYKNRIDLLFSGRVPRPHLFGYSWYSTGHIHPLSIADFHQLLHDVAGMRIVRHESGERGNGLSRLLARAFPNLFRVLCVYQLERVE
jgi:methionine biosynthesis protein MetW